MYTSKSSKLHRRSNWLRKLIKHKSEGYALLTTMVVSSILLTFGATMLTIAVYEGREADRWKRSNEAYFLARAGIAEAVYRLKTDYEDMTVDGYVDPNTHDIPLLTADGERTFSFAMGPVDPNEVHFLGSPYMTGAFWVKTIGFRGQKYRGIETRIERDTFLRYSRFVQQGNLSYASNANIMADLYVGGNLNLNGWPATFWGEVEVGGVINNEPNGIFNGEVSGIGAGIDLDASVELNYYRNLSQGNIVNEGTGLYLGGAVAIDLGLFDFSVPGAPSYNGNPLPPDFNGVVFCESDINLKGVLEGGYLDEHGESDTGITFVAADDIWARGDIRTGNTQDVVNTTGPLTFNRPAGSLQTQTISLGGILTPDSNTIKFRISGSEWKKARMTLKDKHGNEIAHTDLVRTGAYPNGWDPDDNQATVINANDTDHMKFDDPPYTAEIKYYSNGSGNNQVWLEASEGEPVNVGLVAKDQFLISSYTKRQLTIDAAILTLDDDTAGWQASGDYYSHPNGFDTNLWELTINGPIITKIGGSAGPWSSYGSRYYRYDMDMIEHAPPAFPVPADWWKLAYWKHLNETEIDLAAL